MPCFDEFYNTIDDIAEHLRTDFIGPIEENETIEIEDPLNRYSLGILWAQPMDKETGTVDKSELEEEIFEDALENSEEISNVSVFKPSAMGISFAAVPNDQLRITFSYAVYNHSQQTIEENGKLIKKHLYLREPRMFYTDVVLLDKICNKVISN